jgi:uncharacterized phage protein (predicted DNA packaging)
MEMLEALKAHLRIEQPEEDTYLQSLLTMAQATAEDFCGRPFSDETPEPVRLALLLMAGHLYAYREVSDKDAYESMLQAFHALLWPYRDVSKLF